MQKGIFPSRERLVFASSEKDFHQALSEYIGETEKNIFLVDRNTEKFCLPLVKNALQGLSGLKVISIEAGEKGKNYNSVAYIWNELLNYAAGRHTKLINLGGGVITDLGGFTASTFKRGIEFVNIPTSLIGMTDAAIGGKNGINIGNLKNQAGTFALPEAVIIYPQFLLTLTEEERLSGYAEILKTALSFDAALFREMLSFDPAALAGLKGDYIIKTAKIKQEVTQKDLYDKNIRQCLNFGHSLGHAFETFCLNKGQSISHGTAVAAGMICESYISVQALDLPVTHQKMIEDHIRHYFPGIDIKENDIDQLIDLMRYDKKNNDKEIRISLLTDLGKCEQGIHCPDSLIRKSLEHYISQS